MPRTNSDKRLQDAEAEFAAADRGWDYELTQAFGAQAPQARLEPRGRGKPETPLRDAYERWTDALDELNAAQADVAQDAWPRRRRVVLDRTESRL